MRSQTTNMLQAFDMEQDSFTQLVAFYLAARLFTAIYYAVTGLLLPLVKGMMNSQIFSIFIGAAFWIASITITRDATTVGTTAATLVVEHREATEATEGAEAIDETPQSPTLLVLVFIALTIDLFGSAVPIF